ncbi:MAG TPA: low molecular weight phosphatase family protein [Actinomycetota bacterium]|nr:low molecular weight phosphatase family protein [Actinomycetota bacterium]
MTSILVVCTGNICRSPIAEGLLRAALARRLGSDAPDVSSAGTAGWEGSAAMPESVEAARERGVEIERHVARRLEASHVDAADLIVTMASEHRDAITAWMPEVADRVFTLKELVRLVESMAPPTAAPDLATRVAAAAARRREGFTGNPLDDDVADPLGMPLDSYRAIAWELDEWTERLAEGLAGPVPVPAQREEA